LDLYLEKIKKGDNSSKLPTTPRSDKKTLGNDKGSMMTKGGGANDLNYEINSHGGPNYEFATLKNLKKQKKFYSKKVSPKRGFKNAVPKVRREKSYITSALRLLCLGPPVSVTYRVN